MVTRERARRDTDGRSPGERSRADAGGESRDERAQAFTMEAVTASLLLLAAVVFALQTTALTPLSASTSNQYVHDQQAAVAAGVLDGAVANGTLRPALLYWNDTGGQFHRTGDDGTYHNGGPPTAFGRSLNRSFGSRSIAFNVNVLYVSSSGALRTEQLVRLGSPSDNAVRTTRTVTLTDDDVLYAPDGTPTDTTLANASTFYAPDAAPDSPVYNVVRVEVVVWRI